MLFMMGVIFTSILLFILESDRKFMDSHGAVSNVLETGIIIIFSVEFTLRLIVTPLGIRGFLSEPFNL